MGQKTCEKRDDSLEDQYRSPQSCRVSSFWIRGQAHTSGKQAEIGSKLIRFKFPFSNITVADEHYLKNVPPVMTMNELNCQDSRIIFMV